jgi:hypothetical protein
MMTPRRANGETDQHFHAGHFFGSRQDIKEVSGRFSLAAGPATWAGNTVLLHPVSSDVLDYEAGIRQSP